MRTALQVTQFSGIDERKTFGSDLSFAADMKNYRVTEDHTLKKRDGQQLVYSADSEIQGMWSGYLGSERHLLYIAGGRLFRYRPGQGATELGSVGQSPCSLFEFRQRVYIKSEETYCFYDGNSLQPVEGYVPLVVIGSTPAGVGETFEDVNLLSPCRRVEFICDDTSTTYHLPETGVYAIVGFLLNGRETAVSTASRDLAAGTFTLKSPLHAGDTLEVLYQMPNDRREVVLKAKGVMLFGGDTDGHVFLWGNPDAPNVRYHSELADGQPSAEYFPENNYTVIGDTEITDIVSQYDRQLIFTKDRAFYSYCELQTDVLGNVFASFPVYNLNGEKGSLLKNAGCIVNNEPITLCTDGLNRWSSTTVENEKNALCFSGPVQNTMRELLSRGEFDGMSLFNLRPTGELFLFHSGTGALVYQYRIGVWYAYKGLRVKYPVEYEGRLYYASFNQIRRLDPSVGEDVGEPIEAYWETPYLSTGSAPGSRVKLTRMDWTLRAEGQLELHIDFGGEHLPDGSILPRRTLQTDCGGGKVCSGSFRPGGSGSGGMPLASRVKLRIDQSDTSTNCEISELRLISTKKGAYTRDGIH
ncbi:MAG: hypothetical protein J1E00_06695 [Oscillospiraceae bacterium]|nr:hypothetical protein [Oscillospiraceae bacterium]